MAEGKTKERQKSFVVELDLALEVGEAYDRLEGVNQGISIFRFLGMPNNDRFAMHFVPRKEHRGNFTTYHSRYTKTFKIKEKGDCGSVEYTFHVSSVSPDSIHFSKIEKFLADGPIFID